MLQSTVSRDQICTICMTDGTNDQLPCGHRFHKNCLARWLIKNSTCPTCRDPININIKPIRLTEQQKTIIQREKATTRRANTWKTAAAQERAAVQARVSRVSARSQQAETLQRILVLGFFAVISFLLYYFLR